jgi:hypothetical protein
MPRKAEKAEKAEKVGAHSGGCMSTRPIMIRLLSPVLSGNYADLLDDIPLISNFFIYFFP